MSEQVMVVVKTSNVYDSLFHPGRKNNFNVNKNINLQEVLNIVKEKYPNFISFYWKNLVIAKAI